MDHNKIRRKIIGLKKLSVSELMMMAMGNNLAEVYILNNGECVYLMFVDGCLGRIFNIFIFTKLSLRANPMDALG